MGTEDQGASEASASPAPPAATIVEFGLHDSHIYGYYTVTLLHMTLEPDTGIPQVLRQHAIRFLDTPVGQRVAVKVPLHDVPTAMAVLLAAGYLQKDQVLHVLSSVGRETGNNIYLRDVADVPFLRKAAEILKCLEHCLDPKYVATGLETRPRDTLAGAFRAAATDRDVPDEDEKKVPYEKVLAGRTLESLKDFLAQQYRHTGLKGVLEWVLEKAFREVLSERKSAAPAAGPSVSGAAVP
ncbi:MAG: hypothetical protein M3O22_09220 [Pseudomonadota bacterium]|nr:hypothetical protein [Pseudomonadota bacterium]